LDLENEILDEQKNEYQTIVRKRKDELRKTEEEYTNF